MNLALDIAHLLAGGLVVISFVLLYQTRLVSLLDTYVAHAVVLGCAVGWQAISQQEPALYVTALLALVVKAGIIPMALRRIVRKLNIHREVDQVVSVGLTMLAGTGLTALSVLVMLPVTIHESSIAREDLMFALAVVLLGLLMMTTRRNAVSEIVGFMSLENGLVLAATGAKGMPLVVEISVVLSILIAIFVIATFLFHIREQFETMDVQALDRFRGDLHG
jgi:hydrogenase-4 component E